MLKTFCFFLHQCIFLKSQWQFSSLLLEYMTAIHKLEQVQKINAFLLKSRMSAFCVQWWADLHHFCIRCLLGKLSPDHYYTINLLSFQIIILHRQPAELHFTFLDSLIGDERKMSNRAQRTRLFIISLNTKQLQNH